MFKKGGMIWKHEKIDLKGIQLISFSEPLDYLDTIELYRDKLQLSFILPACLLDNLNDKYFLQLHLKYQTLISVPSGKNFSNPI